MEHHGCDAAHAIAREACEPADAKTSRNTTTRSMSDSSAEQQHATWQRIKLGILASYIKRLRFQLKEQSYVSQRGTSCDRHVHAQV